MISDLRLAEKLTESYTFRIRDFDKEEDHSNAVKPIEISGLRWMD